MYLSRISTFLQVSRFFGTALALYRVGNQFVGFNMKGFKGFYTALFMGLLSVSCSDVQFSPGPPPEPSKPDRPDNRRQSYSESFFFDPSDNARKVDVLFVVDNSGSMADEQLKMGERLSSFTNLLSKVDWQLGVTTTDVSDGTYGLKGRLLEFEGTGSYILTKDVANHEQAFLNTVVREETRNCGTNCPSTLEQPLLATLMAISKSQTENRGFFRPGADVAVVILTDEDEMSTGPAEATTGQEVLNAAQQFWGNGKSLTAYGIIVEPDDLDCQAQQGGGAERAGDFIADFVQLTGGTLGSICDKDYSQNLARIGERVLQTLQSIELKEIPDPTTLKLEFDPVENASTYQVSGNKVVFDNPPPEGTRIEVFYKALKDRQPSSDEGDEERGDESDDDEDVKSEVIGDDSMNGI